jgi:outer membrane lipoprotein-sorting protein
MTSPRAIRTAVSALGLAGLAALAAAATPTEAPGPRDVEPSRRLSVLVERIRQQQEHTQTLQAAFVQRKESELLVEPEVATGVFSYAAPDRVRWEYHDPTAISLVITGDHMTTWYRDLEQVEEVEIGRHSQRVLQYLGAGSSLANLLEYFDVRLTMPQNTAQPLELDLEPKFERVARRLQRMQIWVDPTTYLPVRLRYVEADGDVTDYEFSDFQVNRELSADRFELDIPSGVQVRTIDLDRRPGLH